jgi:hypothetical protein
VAVRRAAGAAAPAPRRPAARWRLLPSSLGGAEATAAEALREVGLPAAVALFGVLSSAAALAVAVRSAFFGAGGGGGGGGADGSDAATSTLVDALGRFVEAHVL